MRRFCCVFCLEITFLPPGLKTLLGSLCFLFFSFQSFAFQPPLACAVANPSNYDVICHEIAITANSATSATILSGNIASSFKTTVSNIHADGNSVWFIHNQTNINTPLSNIRSLLSIIIKPNPNEKGI